MNDVNKINILDFIFYAVMIVLIIWLLSDIKDKNERIIELLHLNNKITNDVLIEVTNGFKR
jgi:hypothetical protein